MSKSAIIKFTLCIGALMFFWQNATAKSYYWSCGDPSGGSFLCNTDGSSDNYYASNIDVRQTDINHYNISCQGNTSGSHTGKPYSISLKASSSALEVLSITNTSPSQIEFDIFNVGGGNFTFDIRFVNCNTPPEGWDDETSKTDVQATSFG